MTDQHPITPPPELIAKWASSMCGYYEAARWGADQELEACCEWLQDPDLNVDTYKLRAARRPRPPSLKERALEALGSIERTADAPVPTNKESLSLIRRVLEALPND